MRYRDFGKTGMKVSEIGFGAWALGDESWWGKQYDKDSFKALEKALELGVNFIDTAAVYGDGKSEKLIREFLKTRREKVIVCTKTPPATGVWRPNPWERWEDVYSEAYLRKDIEERLTNLGTDCLDILVLHTWTRAWNRDPGPLLALAKLKKEGKVRAIGISTPEHDQDSVNGPIRDGLVDAIQVIYNIFEQEPASELLPSAKEKGVGIIIRVAFDEGSLTGKYTKEAKFPDGDFRREYFKGERFPEMIDRVDAIKADLVGSGYTMAQAALLYTLANPATSTVIPGIRNVAQAEMNVGVSHLPPMPEALQVKLRDHAWRRGVWYP